MVEEEWADPADLTLGRPRPARPLPPRQHSEPIVVICDLRITMVSRLQDGTIIIMEDVTSTSHHVLEVKGALER